MMVSRSAGSLSWVFLIVLCAYYCSGQQDLIPTCDPLVNYLDNGYDFHKAVAHSDGSHVVAIEDGKQQLSYWDASTLNVSQSPQPAKSPFRLNTFTDSYAFDVPNNVLYYVSGLDWKVHVVMYGDFANVQELTAFPPTVSVTGIRQTNLHIFPLGLSQFLYYGFDYDNSESGLVQVFDITSPTAPSFVGNFSLNNRIMSAQVAFQGNYFYAGVSDSTDSLLSIYDLTSGPLAPTANNTISLGPGVTGFAQVLAVSGYLQRIFVAVDKTIFFLDTSYNPSVQFAYQATDVITKFVATDNQLLVGTQSQGFAILNIFTRLNIGNASVPGPINPSMTNLFWVPGSVFVSNASHTYVYKIDAFCPVYRPANATGPTTGATTGPTTTGPTTTGGPSGPTYLSTTTGAPVQTNTPCALNSWQFGSSSSFKQFGLSSDGTKFAYLDAETNTLYVRDLSNLSLAFLGSYALPKSAYEYIFVRGRNLLVYYVYGLVATDQSIYFVEYSNPSAIYQASQVAILGAQATFKTNANTLYVQSVASGANPIQVFDISDANNPRLLGNSNMDSSSFRSAVFFQSYMYAFAEDSTFVTLYDVSNPVNALYFVQTVISGDSIVGLSTDGKTLYTTMSRNPVTVNAFDVSFPITGTFFLYKAGIPDTVQSVYDNGGPLFFVATYQSGTFVIDRSGNVVATVASPIVQGTQQNPVMSLNSNGAYLFAGTNGGLIVVNAVCGTGSGNTTGPTTGSIQQPTAVANITITLPVMVNDIATVNTSALAAAFVLSLNLTDPFDYVVVTLVPNMATNYNMFIFVVTHVDASETNSDVSQSAVAFVSQAIQDPQSLFSISLANAGVNPTGLPTATAIVIVAGTTGTPGTTGNDPVTTGSNPGTTGTGSTTLSCNYNSQTLGNDSSFQYSAVTSDSSRFVHLINDTLFVRDLTGFSLALLTTFKLKGPANTFMFLPQRNLFLYWTYEPDLKDGQFVYIVDYANASAAGGVKQTGLVPMVGFQILFFKINGNIFYARYTNTTGGQNNQVFDITSPGTPRFLGNLDLDYDKMNSALLYQNYMFVSNEDASVSLYNVSNPASATFIVQTSITGSLRYISPDGSTLYTTAGRNPQPVLSAYNISNPTLIRVIHSQTVQDNIRSFLDRGGQILLVGTDVTGILALDKYNEFRVAAYIAVPYATPIEQQPVTSISTTSLGYTYATTAGGVVVITGGCAPVPVTSSTTTIGPPTTTTTTGPPTTTTTTGPPTTTTTTALPTSTTGPATPVPVAANITVTIPILADDISKVNTTDIAIAFAQSLNISNPGDVSVTFVANVAKRAVMYNMIIVVRTTVLSDSNSATVSQNMASSVNAALNNPVSPFSTSLSIAGTEPVGPPTASATIAPPPVTATTSTVALPTTTTTTFQPTTTTFTTAQPTTTTFTTAQQTTTSTTRPSTTGGTSGTCQLTPRTFGNDSTYQNAGLSGDGTKLVHVVDSTLFVRDLAGFSLIVVGTFQLNSANASLFVTPRNLYVYVGTVLQYTSQVLFVVDFSNVSAIYTASTTVLVGTQASMKINGNILYVQTSNRGSNVNQAFDITDPFNVVSLGNIVTTDSSVLNTIVFAKNYAFAGSDVISLISIRNSTNFDLVSSSTGITGDLKGVSSDGNTLYTSVSNFPDSVLYAYDVSSPLNNTFLRWQYTYSDFPQTILDNGGPLVFVGTYQSGILVIDRSDLAKVQLVATIPAPPIGTRQRPVESLISNGVYVFSGTAGGLMELHSTCSYPPTTTSTGPGTTAPTSGTTVPTSGTTGPTSSTTGPTSSTTGPTSSTTGPTTGSSGQVMATITITVPIVVGNITSLNTTSLTSAFAQALNLNATSDITITFSSAAKRAAASLYNMIVVVRTLVSSSASTSSIAGSTANSINMALANPTSPLSNVLASAGANAGAATATVTIAPATTSTGTGVPLTTGTTSTTGRPNACTPNPCTDGFSTCTASSAGGYTCSRLDLPSPIACAGAPASGTIIVYGSAGPYKYSFGNLTTAPTNPLNSGNNTVSIPTGTQAIFIYDASATVPIIISFKLSCDWCRIAPCAAGTRCLASSTAYACVGVTTSVVPCASYGNITVYSSGTGLAGLQYSVDSSSLSANNVFNVSAGTHVVSVTNGVTTVSFSNVTLASSVCVSYKYLGCYQDNAQRQFAGPQRDLANGPFYSPDYLTMSASICVGFCLNVGPYKFAGTQSGSECWCGNTYGQFSGALDESNCGIPCVNNAGFCGGKNFNNIYDTGISIDYCNSNPCGAGQTCWNRVGGFSCLSSSVSYDKCNGTASISLNVTGNGTFAFTSNGAAISNTFSAAPGSYLVVVTDKLGYKANITVPVVAQTVFNSSSANWRYVGCFNDNPTGVRDLPIGPLSTPNITIDQCYAFCRGQRARYMGLQNGVECWCGYAYGSYASAGSNCNAPCPNDPCRKCGGIKINSVYDISDACNPNPCTANETCLLAGTNYGCVSATLVQSKCNNDATVQVATRGTGAPFAWNLNGATLTAFPAALSYAGSGGNQLSVTNSAGSTAFFSFNISVLNFTVVSTPQGCTDPPTTLVTVNYNRPFSYNGTLVADGVSYNQSRGGYIALAGKTYVYTSECGTTSTFSLPAPATPTSPGPVNASINLQTQRMTITFFPPASLSVAVTQYILAVGLLDGTTRKVAIAGPGSDIAFDYGTMYFFYVQAQSCSGLGAASASSSFLAVVPPVAPVRVTTSSALYPQSSTQGNATITWVQTVNQGDTLIYEVECAFGGGSFSVCATPTDRTASFMIKVATNYTVRVRAKNIAMQYGAYSDLAYVYLGAPCLTPTNFAASAMDYNARTIALTWNGASAGCTYNVESAGSVLAGATPVWNLVSSSTAFPTYLAGPYTEDNTYAFRVSACNANGCSAPTPTLSPLFSAPPPAPTNLAKGPQVISTTAANVSLTWTQVIPQAKMTLPLTYTIQTSADGQSWTNASTASFSGGSGTQPVSGIVPTGLGANVFVRVIGANANGYSTPSSPLNFTIPAPPPSVPFINVISPMSVTQAGGATLTITGLNIANGANAKCKFESTAPKSSVVVPSVVTGANPAALYCVVPSFPSSVSSVTPNAWMVSVASDGTTYSPAVGLTVSPAPYVTKASPVFINTLGDNYVLTGNYFDSCQSTSLVFGGTTIIGSLKTTGTSQQLVYALPAGSVFSPFVQVSFLCDNNNVFSGLIAYYDSSIVGVIDAATWNEEVVGDQFVNIAGNWASYAKSAQYLPAPQARLYNQAQLGTYGYFYAQTQWNGSNIALTEFPLPFSSTVSSSNVFDVQISLDGGYTWIAASSSAKRITVAYAGFSTACTTNNCQACATAPGCTWYSKGDGRGWCSPSGKYLAATQAGAVVKPSTSCAAIGVADAFNPVPISASLTPIDATYSLLAVTLQVTFSQSSESPSTAGTTIEYNVSALSSVLDTMLTISGPVSFSYFNNFAISTPVALQFSGRVKKSDLSNYFPVNIIYYDANRNYYTDSETFNLRGGATITTKDIQATETLFLLNGVSYPSSARPIVNVDFPSYQFATSASLNLDGVAVQQLTTASTTYTIDHVNAKLAVGPHALTAVVNGQITSTFSFYVVPAPAWISAVHDSALTTIVATTKGLAMQAPFPAKNIFPTINLGSTTLNPSVSGSFAFTYPLNGLVSASVQESAAFPPTVLDDPAQGAFAIATNLQTVVGGATPTIQLTSVRANASFYSTLPLDSFTKTLDFLGSVSVAAPLRLRTVADITAQTTAGVDMGYGLKGTGSLNIVGNVAPFIQANGQFSVTNIQVTENSNLAFSFAGDTPTVDASSGISVNVSADFFATGALKVVLYSGSVFSISCTNDGLGASGLVLTCDTTSIEDMDTSIFTAAFNVPTPISTYHADATQPPSAEFDDTRATRSIEERPAVYYYAKYWSQIPLPKSHKRDIIGTSGILVADVYDGAEGDGIKFATNAAASTSVAVWVGFNNSRPEPFGYNIQFSTFNSVTRTWTTPDGIDASIIVAGAPQITTIADTGKFVAVWESQNLQPGASVTIEQALDTTEVYAGLWLAGGSKWTITRLTDNSVFDGTPTICSTVLNGAELVAVVWQKGNFLHPQDIVLSVGTIKTDIGAKGTWVAPKTIATGITGLSALSCSWSQDTVAITYTQTTGSDPARVTMSLYINENSTTPVTIPTISDTVADLAPVQTLTVSGQFLSVWTHGTKILVKSTLLNGDSGGGLIQIAVPSQPSLVSLSATDDYVVLTYYVTEANVGKFYMRTLASGASSFSDATLVLTLNTNENAIAARSQFIENANTKQLLLVYTTQILGGNTDHHYSLINLQPVLDVKFVAITANIDGTLEVDLAITNKGTWVLNSGDKNVFIYQGDAKAASTQLSSDALPTIAVGAVYAITLTLTVPSVDGGYVWVEITTPADTYLDFATSFGYPVFTPTTGSFTASSSPAGGISISASVGATSDFKCSSVVVPCVLDTLDPSTGAYVNLYTTTVTVPCGSSSFIQTDIQESQIKGTLRLTAGQTTLATTSFLTVATSTLSVSPFPELSISANDLSINSPFLGAATITATVQNTALFTAKNVPVQVFIDSASGTQVGSTTIPVLAAQASVIVQISLAAIVKPGNYSLYVVANNARTIGEANYANNAATLVASLAVNAWVQVSATAIRIDSTSVQFSVSNLGDATLVNGAVTLSVGSTSFGSISITNIKPLFCKLIKVNTSTDLTKDGAAPVIITIAAPLSGSFTPVTVTTTVGATADTILPDCGDVPVNAPPGLQADNLIAIVGIPFIGEIRGTSVSPFLAPLLAFSVNGTLPTGTIVTDPCAGVNSSSVCKKQRFAFTPTLSDIPEGQMSVNKTFTVALQNSADNSTLSAQAFTLTITSCGNGVKEGPEQCDGGANCSSSCAFITPNSTATSAPTPAPTSKATPSPSTGPTSGQTTDAGAKKDNGHSRRVRLGLGLGLGLGLPIVLGAVGAAVYVKFYKPTRARNIRMNVLN